ncbi:hypothetical protein PHMEG_00010889 [Phytophthora megakarya]|uniref:Uncharacterized protein n=1 Tax=Phytophthora megakarya TaxID=4795 RepID=A0A225WEJ9_9STRA|nr:hypothetical protein PHMEG_00010889 [Phytophthora megakarya]
MALAPVSWDAPPVYGGPDIHLVGVPASIVAVQGGAKVYPGHGGLEVLLCFERLDATDLQDLNALMDGDVADCLPTLRQRSAPVSIAAEVNSIAGQRELAALLGQFPLGQCVRALKQDRIDGENFLRQGHRDAEFHHQARIQELTDQVTQLQTQLRDSEAARQAAERRAAERILDVNALVDFLIGNQPMINVMFNWMRLAALLHHFAEGTPIPEGWLIEAFYISAEGILRLRQANREPTPPWYPMGRCFIKDQKRKQSTRETEALQATLPESSDDATQDPSYELSQTELDMAARAEAAAENDESSDESDESEEGSKPAATRQSPARLRESKTGSKNNNGGKTKSHGASAEPKSRVITSPKSQAVPKSSGTPRERKMPALSVASFLGRAKVEVSSEGP